MVGEDGGGLLHRLTTPGIKGGTRPTAGPSRMFPRSRYSAAAAADDAPGVKGCAVGGNCRLT